MTRDARWPLIPFILIRSIQLVFAVIILGMTGHIVSIGGNGGIYWWAPIGLFISLVMLIWIVINFVLFFIGLLLPVAVVAVDAFIVFFLLLAMSGTGASGYVGSSCKIYVFDYLDYTYESDTYWTPCLIIKGMFSMELLAMFLFIATLVLASLTLHKTRKDLRGKKYNAGLPFISGSSEQAHVEQGQQYYAGDQKIEEQQHFQQPAPAYTQQPQQPVYPQQQIPLQQVPPQQQYQQGPVYDNFVSPPSSPRPVEIVPQSTGGYMASGHFPSEMPAAHTHVPKGNELPS